MSDPYQVLGVDRGASPAQVKKAYRRLAHAHHPDRNPADAGAAARFKQIAEAYRVLSDPRRRTTFNETGRRDQERRPADPHLQVFLATFDQQVQLMVGLWFDEILPRMLDSWYRGRGVELLARLVEDLDQHRLLQRAAGPPPSPASVARAREVLAACPVTWRPVEMVDGSGALVLGYLHHQLELDGGGARFSYGIELYPGSFLASGIRDPDALGAAILPVLARECGRYLETFVPQRDQPLTMRAARAAGVESQRLTPEVARWRDTWFLVKRWGGVALFVVVVLACLAAILPFV